MQGFVKESQKSYDQTRKSNEKKPRATASVSEVALGILFNYADMVMAFSTDIKISIQLFFSTAVFATMGIWASI